MHERTCKSSNVFFSRTDIVWHIVDENENVRKVVKVKMKGSGIGWQAGSYFSTKHVIGLCLVIVYEKCFPS